MKRLIVLFICLMITLPIVTSSAFAIAPLSNEFVEINNQLEGFATKYPQQSLAIISVLEGYRLFGFAGTPENWDKEIADFYNKITKLSTEEQDMVIMTLAGTVSANLYISEHPEAKTEEPVALETEPELLPSTKADEPKSIKRSGSFKLANYIEIKPSSFKTVDEVTAKNASLYSGFGYTSFGKVDGMEMLVCTIKLTNLSKSNRPIYDLIHSVNYTNADGYTYEGTLYAENRQRQVIETNTMNLDPNVNYYIHLVCNIDKKNLKLDDGAYFTLTISDPEKDFETFELRILY